MTKDAEKLKENNKALEEKLQSMQASHDKVSNLGQACRLMLHLPSPDVVAVALG